jgi:hypothetical protein
MLMFAIFLIIILVLFGIYATILVCRKFGGEYHTIGFLLFIWFSLYLICNCILNPNFIKESMLIREAGFEYQRLQQEASSEYRRLAEEHDNKMIEQIMQRLRN